MRQSNSPDLLQWMREYGSHRLVPLGALRGRDIWPGATLYHGGPCEAIESIVTAGVDMKMAQGGYFGFGFYTTDDFDLAWDNYADRGRGAVVELRLSDTANILDMRSEADFEVWKTMPRPGSDGLLEAALRKRKIDGVFDRSMGGLCLYNPACFTVIGVRAAPSPVAP